MLMLLWINPSGLDLDNSPLKVDPTSASSRFWYGNLIALAAGCFAGVHYRFSRKLKLNYSFSTFGLLASLFSMTFLILVSLFYQGSVQNLPQNSLFDILASK